MKKYIAVFLIFLLCLLDTACGKDEQGSYYPNCTKMYDNLEAAGYKVSLTSDINGEDTRTYLLAVNGENYIIFYWLSNEKDVDVITSQLEKEYDDYDKFVSVQKDSKFGSFVFCGTSDAINASGITFVDVKVK